MVACAEGVAQLLGGYASVSDAGVGEQGLLEQPREDLHEPTLGAERRLWGDPQLDTLSATENLFQKIRPSRDAMDSTTTADAPTTHPPLHPYPSLFPTYKINDDKKKCGTEIICRLSLLGSSTSALVHKIQPSWGRPRVRECACAQKKKKFLVCFSPNKISEKEKIWGASSKTPSHAHGVRKDISHMENVFSGDGLSAVEHRARVDASTSVVFSYRSWLRAWY